MKPSDRNLGMDRRISRRDFLHGAGTLATGTLIPGLTLTGQVLASGINDRAGSNYPPALTGLRGNHIGSFEVAHQLALKGQRNWGSVKEPDSDVYDLVVVGGGISGLAAAHFYRQQKPKARMLILDNHDDFGGHAKRNEFQVGGRTLYYGLPGFDATGLPQPGDSQPYIHHFPDGNASVARLLVRQLIPSVAPGNTMEDVVTAHFDYAKLDQANSPVRLRLGSTVVRVANDGDPGTSKRVGVSYVRANPSAASPLPTPTQPQMLCWRRRSSRVTAQSLN